MKVPQTILSGIDYSDASFDALRLGSRLASAWSARLFVLHVVDRDELDEIRAQAPLEDAGLLERAQPQLEKTARQAAGAGVELQTEVRIGHPFAEVLETASRTSADLLVLGAHGAGLEEDRTGALASRCLRKAPLPVLLVREGQHLPFTPGLKGLFLGSTAEKIIHRAPCSVLAVKPAGFHFEL